MSEFNREDRYIVIKHSDMEKAPADLRKSFSVQCRKLYEAMLTNGAPARSFVVVEADWPEYEPVWQMIERRVSGQPLVTAAELEAVLHWRGKHAQAILERDALQLRLNAVDQRCDDLTELLNKSLIAIKRTLQAGRDRIIDMGGDCDSVEYMMNSDLTVQEIRTALKAADEACQFPQSCTTRCDCDIPDFSPGNGNKARRRAEALTKSCQQPQAHPARCGCEQKP
ncbi:hypothetical protein HNR03_004044 [Pseudomonas sp. JAI111]|uniref:hypothetical protein n=1 Tax=Pseudomonas sp. JAI111 TaxID=2735913 RepID=UPI002169CE00|nr:hypothetical protein [Pseudomonas sp. JAI111]MCS3839433.1 hypothetical protein [Pseudomonas sp. JAI111]